MLINNEKCNTLFFVISSSNDQILNNRDIGKYENKYNPKKPILTKRGNEKALCRIPTQ